MKFAHFSHIWNKSGYTPQRRYEELWRELQLCDELGFDYGFCVEHHFRPDESWISSPSLYAVGAGSRTKRLQTPRRPVGWEWRDGRKKLPGRVPDVPPWRETMAPGTG